MAKVIKRFRDKETGKIHNKGTDYNGTPERIKVLQEKGFLEGELKVLSDNEVIETIQEDGIDINELTIKQLHEFAEQIDVEIPKEITKRDDIIEFLSDKSD